MMCAQILNIDDKIHPGHIAMVNLDAQFAYNEGEDVDSATILENPNLSLYCLDDPNRRAIFVETPPGIDLARAPFYYQTQYKEALRLVAVPYDDLLQLSATLPRPTHLILIHTTGRAGTTLLSHALNELQAVVSFPEPGWLSQLVTLRMPGGKRDAELRTLIESGVRLICRPTPLKPKVSTFALKLQPWVIEIGDLLYALFPEAPHLFLYRDAENWSNSFFRIFSDMGFNVDELSGPVFGNQENDRRVVGLFDQYLPSGFGSILTTDYWVVIWLSAMHGYLRLHEAGVPFLAVRYEDLNENRESTMAAILEYCQIGTGDVTHTLRAFQHDAQAGSLLARRNPNEGNQHRMTDDQRERMWAILRQHLVVNTPDHVLPGTLIL